MKRSGYWLLSLVMVLGLILSACGTPSAPATPTSPTPTTPTTQKPTTPAPVSSLEELAKKEGQIVLWAHSFQNSADFVAAWKAKYPSIEMKVWDAQSPELMAKLMEETKAGRYTADFITLDDGSIPGIRDQFAAYDWPNTKNWDEGFRPSHNLWRFYARSPKLPYYNTNLLAAADAPKSIEDLNNAKWRGKVLQSYSNEQLPLIFANKWGEPGKLNWDKSFSFWTDVYKNTAPRAQRGFEGAVALLAAGEASMHQMGSYNTFLRYIWRGAPLALAPLTEVPTTQWGCGVLKNAPHPNAARLFADFFTSPQGQAVYANGQGTLINSPEGAKLAKPNLAMAEKGIKVFITPAELFTNENNKKATDFWQKLNGIS